MLDFLNDLTQEQLNQIIILIPTVLFLFFVVRGFFKGLRRGLRKELILLGQALIVGGLCLCLFFYCVKSEQIDSILLQVANSITGDVAKKLGLEGSYTGLRDLAYAYILKMATSGNESYAIIVQSGEAYIYAIIELVYRLVFFIVCLVLFYVVDFIMYLIYLTFYSERKRKRKFKKMGRKYDKKKLKGALVGTVGGLIAGSIFLSNFGSLFYVVSNKGEGKFQNIEVDSGEYANTIKLFKAIDQYGSGGVYKVVNSLNDENDVPYYLFAIDLVFSGTIVDEAQGINETAHFIDDLGIYTDLATDTLSLIYKYNKEALDQSLTSGDFSNVKDLALETLQKEDFQKEFSEIIDNFSGTTFLKGLVFSLIDGIASNLDSFIGTDGETNEYAELLNILFKKGYYSETNSEESYKTSGEILPYLNASKIITKSDIQTILNIALSVVDFSNPNLIDTSNIFSMVQDYVLPNIQKLSIFSTERAEEMNGVLTRLYCYVENKFLTLSADELADKGVTYKASGITYKELKEENVNWTSELSSLLNVANDGIEIYNYLVENSDFELELNAKKQNEDSTEESDNDDLAKAIVGIFDEEKNPKVYAAFENICSTLENSKLAGVVLGSNRMYVTIQDAIGNLMSSTSPDSTFKLPENINYVNTYDASGNLVKHGEIYSLLQGVKLVVKNESLLDAFLGDENEEDKTSQIISALADVAADKDENGKKLTDYLMGSTVLRTAISSFVIGGIKDIEFYIPDSCLEEGSQTLTEESLTQILDCLPSILDLYADIADSSNIDYGKLIDGILDDETLLGLFGINKDGDYIGNSSVILEGTLANIILSNEKLKETLYIGDDLKNPEDWVSTETKQGELSNLLSFIKTSNIDIASVISPEEGTDTTDAIIKMITDIDRDSFENLFDSNMIRGTVTKLLVGDESLLGDKISIYVPNSARDANDDESLPYIIKKQDLVDLFNAILDLGIIDSESGTINTDTSAILTSVYKNRNSITNSSVLTTTLVNTIVNGNILPTSESFTISFPEELDANHGASTSEEVEGSLYYYTNDSENAWKKEIINIFEALGALVDFDETDPDATLSIDNINIDSVKTIVTDYSKKEGEVYPNKVRLQKILASKVLCATMTNVLNDALDLESDEPYTFEDFDSLFEAISIFKLDVGSMIDGGDIDFTAITNHFLDINKQFIDWPKDETFTEDYLVELTEKYDTKTALDIMFESDLFPKILTTFIEDLEIDGFDSSLLIDESTDVVSKDELGKLLDVFTILKDSNGDPISSLDNLSDIDYNSIIFDMNDVDEETGKTNLDKLYDSQIVWKFVSNALDDVLYEEGSSDSLLTKEQRDSLKDENNLYKKEEVAKLIDALSVFEVEDEQTHQNRAIKSIDEFSEIDYASFIFELNKKPEGKEETKLHILYSSSVIQSILSDKLDDALKDSGVCSDDDLDAIKENGIYKEDEIAKLIDAINELGISSLDTFDGFGDIIGSLRDDSTSHPGQTKLHVIYSSSILKSTISDKVDEFIGGFVESSVLTSAKGGNAYYPEAELDAMLAAIDVFEIDISNFSFDFGMISSLNDKVDETDPNSETKIEKVCDSKIMQGIISKQLDGFLTDSLIDSSIITYAKNQNTEDTNVYSKDEITKFVAALGTMNVFDDDGNLAFNNNTFSTFTDDDKLDTIYASTLMKGILTKQVDSMIFSMVNMDYVETSKDEIGCYTKGEISSFAKVIDGLGMLDGTTGEASTSTISINAIDLDEAYNSCIIKSLLTKTLQDTGLFVDHDDAYENEYVYKKSELTTLKGLLGEGTLNSFNSDSLTIGALKDAYANSYLLKATISEKVLDFDYLVFPKSVIDTDACMKTDEFTSLMNSLVSFSGKDDDAALTELTSIDINKKLGSDALDSIIMRATITKNLVDSNSTNNSIILYCRNGAVVNDVDDSSIVIIDKTELTNMFACFGDSGLSIPTVNSLEDLAGLSNLDAYLASDIIRYSLVNNVLFDTTNKTSIFMISTTKGNPYNVEEHTTNETVCDLVNKTSKSYTTMTADEVKACLNSMN